MTAEAALAATAQRWVALVGRPNVGKSALFNALTGLRQKVANYPGVTVERREGRLRGAGGTDWRVIDLPGVSSLVPRSPDEGISADVILGRRAGVPTPDLVIAVVNAVDLRQGLFLVSQLLEMGVPLIVDLNMIDEARRLGVSIDATALSRHLGNVPVFATTATSGGGVPALIAAIRSGPWCRTDAAPPVIPGIHGLPEPSVARWNALRSVVIDGGFQDAEVRARWRFADVTSAAVQTGSASDKRHRSDRIDRVLLHPLIGPVIFVLIMGTLFQGVFALAETPTGWIEDGFAAGSAWLRGWLEPGLFADFIIGGVLAGVSAVLVFLPQILILFLFLGLLEDTGYMSRAAFLVDRPFRALGLSGRSFIPLLSSFGCAVPGILATRTIENRRERLITILVAPLMTCSARLPVYTLLLGSFIDDRRVFLIFGLRGLVLLGLYVFGLVLAGLAAVVMNHFLRRTGHGLSVMEMAPYRQPKLRSVALHLGQRAGSFLRRAGTVILAVSVVIWVLLNFPRSDAATAEANPAERSRVTAESFGGQLGHAIEPVIRPLGYDWRIGIGLIGSLVAREVFVSTMSVVYAVDADKDEDQAALSGALKGARDDRSGRPVYTLATVLSLLVFYAVALQCVSTVAVVHRETGSIRWTLFQLAFLTGLAWILAFLTYQGASFLGG